MKKRRMVRAAALMILFTCFGTLKAFAIDDDGGLGSDVPVDGGLSLLVAAGVGYGIRKVRNGRKKNR